MRECCDRVGCLRHVVEHTLCGGRPDAGQQMEKSETRDAIARVLDKAQQCQHHPSALRHQTNRAGAYATNECAQHQLLLATPRVSQAAPRDGAASLQSALAAVVEQTGKTSLRLLVRDTVGLVERHYIGAALQLADGNRTAAAEILGLSRQGFYKKLAQYEMEGHSKVSLEAAK